MFYLICFIITVVLVLVLMYNEKAADIHMTLLTVVIAVGTGGYYALSHSGSVEEAILANKIVYVTACFAPILVLFIICNICRIHIPRALKTGLFALQTLIFVSACSVGRSTIFYETTEYHIGEAGGYLLRTYGPMHTVHLVLLLLYTLLSAGIGLYSLNRRTVVSRLNVYLLLSADLFSIGIYLMQRIVSLHYDMIPIAFSAGACIYLILLLKLYSFSMDNNPNILASQIRDTAYIFFNRQLKYMGCSEYASTLFPELTEWELEKKIPGNGGRFNTFLRQPLLSFVKKENQEKPEIRTYYYKERAYRYEICVLRTAGNRKCGYQIRVNDVSDILGKTAGSGS